MFTGIIDEVGIVKDLKLENNFGVIEIQCNEILKDLKIGESIATNGVCLTVTDKYDYSFKADIMQETLKKSNLGIIELGDMLNLERALKINDRINGHIVSGHIDGTGTIELIEIEDKITIFTISAATDILQYVIYKGSIGIDGISLTVFYVDENIFKVSVIPHSMKNTNLSIKKLQDKVNLECDLIGKYIEKLINKGNEKYEKQSNSNIDIDFLTKNGF